MHLHVEFAYNNSVSAATGLAPNEVHMGRLPRLPLTIFERTGVFGNQSLARDHLAYCDLATDRQQRAYDIVREHHALTVSRVERRHSAVTNALRGVLTCAFGGSVWVYSTAATIRQGAKTNTDIKALRAKLSLSWTGPSKVLAVGPCTPAYTRTAHRWVTSSSIWIYPPTCPSRTLAGAFRCNPASSVPNPTTKATYRSICQRV